MEHSKSLLAAFCLALTAAMIAGCGPLDYRQSGDASYYPVRYGVIEGIDYVQREGGPSGAGALISAIAGGVIRASRSGGGTGNTVAAIAGAIGGRLVGNEVERRGRRDNERFSNRHPHGRRLVSQRDHARRPQSPCPGTGSWSTMAVSIGAGSVVTARLSSKRTPRNLVPTASSHVRPNHRSGTGVPVRVMDRCHGRNSASGKNQLHFRSQVSLE